MQPEQIDGSRELENVEGSIQPEKELAVSNDKNKQNHPKENGLHDNNQYAGYTQEKLAEMMIELSLQNEYMKSQFECLKNLPSATGISNQQDGLIEREGMSGEDVKELQQKIELLSSELLEEKQTRSAAEEALKHLRAEFSEADAKAQNLAAKLTEAQQKMDEEIKERDEKYSELDSKFTRLHKRAKQRIQDTQKEKDDLEVQYREIKEKAEQASSQQSALQQDLERTRQQAKEALKAMDTDRQQLRSANNKLRDEIQELRHSLEPKEHAFEALQQSLLEKEQMLEDLQGLLQASDMKRHSSLAELSAKHQKQLESLDAQIGDALTDRSKATETITYLQGTLAEKESKIAEMEAASSGEMARLRAAIETLKGEIVYQKNEHLKEKENWETAFQALKTKLEVSESNCMRAQIEVAKMRSQLDLELSVQSQQLSAKDAELMSANEEINRLENEFASYKIRAHTLLQKKDAEVASARDNEQLKAQEESLKEAEKEMISISAERDKALQDLQAAVANHQNELAVRDATLASVEEKIREMEMKLTSASARHESERKTWELNLKTIEETWQLRYESSKAQQNQVSPSPDTSKELGHIKMQYKMLKEEHDTLRDLADKMIEEKDKEISKLIDDSKKLQRLLDTRPTAEENDGYTTEVSGFQKQENSYSSTSAAEQQILILARQQAQREEELTQTNRHILVLQEEIEELERENRLHRQQEAMLKEQFREMERSTKREGVDLTYLKNVILKLLETGEVEALLPVIGMLLQFSPQEIQKCQQEYRSLTTEVPQSPANDGSGSGTLSLFSKFSFS
ncbi:protein GRIP [Impatiens glandulifera]|uniref:protein GRIP n=1 Tax=Impatiens glandulifera TaxID=253017 RepID=UPI001FB0EBC5|nr:protein GRIP [Impatiens glandulifera]XP_047330042.1 protein GRIP [Impatiens glandulifera]